MKNKRLELILDKIKEACMSVLPIALIILLLSFTICPLPNHIFVAFIVGTIMMVVGLGLFSLGAERSMERIGAHIGTNLTRSKKIPVIAIISLIVGVLITICEPDLHVLASYTGNMQWPFILAVAAGLGFFLVVAVLRIIFKIKFKFIIFGGYGVILLLATIAYFADPTFLAIAFDAGGVTTGAMSVPFVISIGSGIAAITASGEDGEDNNFGLMAICSIGPIISILVMGLAGGFKNISYTEHLPSIFENSKEMGLSFLSAAPEIVGKVLLGLVPILLFFFIYQLFTERVHRKEMAQIFIGAGYIFVGMILFLVGVEVGFMPIGSFLGDTFAQMDGYLSWIVVPVGMLIGFCMTYAEPAVGVLNKQVEEATSGTIPSKIIPMAMALGVALSSGIAMVRALTGIPILPFLLIGYIAAVVLAFYCPPIFSSIAFDAGGVASGVMAATFLLPLAIGVCSIRPGANVMVDAFGTIALVAMAPTVSIQIVGVMYKLKHRESQTEIVGDGDILDFESLGEDFIEELATVSGEKLNVTAIANANEEEIEIIEFVTEFDDLLEDEPADSAKV